MYDARSSSGRTLRNLQMCAREGEGWTTSFNEAEILSCNIEIFRGEKRWVNYIPTLFFDPSERSRSSVMGVVGVYRHDVDVQSAVAVEALTESG